VEITNNNKGIAKNKVEKQTFTCGKANVKRGNHK